MTEADLYYFAKLDVSDRRTFLFHLLAAFPADAVEVVGRVPVMRPWEHHVDEDSGLDLWTRTSLGGMNCEDVDGPDEDGAKRAAGDAVLRTRGWRLA
jgi:hypothetical protein